MLNKAVKPGIDGIGFAGAQQAFAGDAGGAQAGVDFQEGGGALAQVGFGAMVAEFFECLPFSSGSGKGTGQAGQPPIWTVQICLNSTRFNC